MFYSEHLSKRTFALEALEREGRLDLVTTNRTLITLRQISEKIASGQFGEGWELMTRLDLLPLSRAELETKRSRYNNLDPLVQQAFPFLLGTAMEFLYEEHRRVKSTLRDSSPVVHARLAELQEMAGLLYKFAGLTNMPDSTKEVISRKEAQML